jgi:hypothetical protein
MILRLTIRRKLFRCRAADGVLTFDSTPTYRRDYTFVQVFEAVLAE